jgi:diguanylate cyclase (GGDEF)-like protein
MLLGVIGFVGTGSFWYLAGSLVSGALGAWRLRQTHMYATSRANATAVTWAKRSIWGGWATAAVWGGWSAVVLFEPEKSIVIMVISAQSGCVIGAAVRNCGVRVVAEGQALITLIPLFVACLLSGNIYLMLYAGFVLIHLYAALALGKTLHRQTLRLLLQDEEKTELVGRLEAAKQELEAMNQNLETLAGTDALTGVANRRAFDLAVAREWRRLEREQTSLSLLLLDVDHFKAFNDLNGHQAGDACLRDVAAAIVSALRRPDDLVARYGGEEFAVLLPSTPRCGGIKIAEDIREAISAAAIPHDASHFRRIIASIGVAWTASGQETTAEQLTARADASLYAAKRAGRNCVHASDIGEFAETGETIRGRHVAVPSVRASRRARIVP